MDKSFYMNTTTGKRHGAVHEQHLGSTLSTQFREEILESDPILLSHHSRNSTNSLDSGRESYTGSGYPFIDQEQSNLSPLTEDNEYEFTGLAADDRYEQAPVEPLDNLVPPPLPPRGERAVQTTLSNLLSMVLKKARKKFHPKNIWKIGLTADELVEFCRLADTAGRKPLFYERLLTTISFFDQKHIAELKRQCTPEISPSLMAVYAFALLDMKKYRSLRRMPFEIETIRQILVTNNDKWLLDTLDRLLENTNNDSDDSFWAPDGEHKTSCKPKIPPPLAPKPAMKTGDQKENTTGDVSKQKPPVPLKTKKTLKGT